MRSLSPPGPILLPVITSAAPIFCSQKQAASFPPPVFLIQIFPCNSILKNPPATYFHDSKSMQNQETALSDTDKLKTPSCILPFFFFLLLNHHQQARSVKKSDDQVSHPFPINNLHFKLLTSKSRGFFSVSELQTVFWAAGMVTKKVLSCKSARLPTKTMVWAP